MIIPDNNELFVYLGYFRNTIGQKHLNPLYSIRFISMNYSNSKISEVLSNLEKRTDIDYSHSSSLPNTSIKKFLFIFSLVLFLIAIIFVTLSFIPKKVTFLNDLQLSGLGIMLSLTATVFYYGFDKYKNSDD